MYVVRSTQQKERGLVGPVTLRFGGFRGGGGEGCRACGSPFTLPTRSRGLRGLSRCMKFSHFPWVFPGFPGSRAGTSAGLGGWQKQDSGQVEVEGFFGAFRRGRIRGDGDFRGAGGSGAGFLPEGILRGPFMGYASWIGVVWGDRRVCGWLGGFGGGRGLRQRRGGEGRGKGRWFSYLAYRMSLFPGRLVGFCEIFMAESEISGWLSEDYSKE